MRSKKSEDLAYRRQVLAQLDGDYLLDYALFSGVLRDYVTTTLFETFEQQKAADEHNIHRRLFTFALYTQEYFAYEDLGAFLDALLTHALDPDVPVVDRLMSYRSGEVKLADVVARFDIKSAQELHTALGLGSLVPPSWSSEFPTLDLVKALKVAARFFFDDCVRNQKAEGVSSFNKLKHGLMVVPDGRRYVREDMIDAPAAIIDAPPRGRDSRAKPIAVFAIQMADGHLLARVEAIHFVQTNLRLIAALMAVMRHPVAVRRRRDVDPLELFKHRAMVNVMSFIAQVTEKSAEPW